MAEKSARSKEKAVDITDMTLDQAKEYVTELGKKRGQLTYEDIAERLSSFVLDSEQMDEFYEYLGEQGVDIVSEADGDEENPGPQELEKEEEFDLNDLRVPPGV